MRRAVRVLIPLAAVLAGIAYAVVPLVDGLTLRWFVRDLDIRARLIASAVEEPLLELLEDPARDRVRVQRVRALFDRVTKDERLFALGFCDASGAVLYKTETLPSGLRCPSGPPAADGSAGRMVKHEHGPLHVATSPLVAGGTPVGALMVVHDMSFVERRSADTKRYIVYLFGAIGGLVALVTVLVVELSWRGWIARTTALIRTRSRTGVFPPHARELRPIARDLAVLVQELEHERRARDESQVRWEADALRRILLEDLRGDEVLCVSNREPYIHVRRGPHIEVQRPASGLVTALEPVMRACSGTWIAHGSGDADRELVDARDVVMVPPERPAYRLRRVWLSEAEEAGYYYGFANEGLWPLCHIAHTSPTFRAQDWQHYDTVNQRFADVVAAEARSPNPLVLVQDYHFALLPAYIRARLPEATIVTFWHIPWPNPEAFGICPWRERLLEGLLGSSILGFHTQFHCNNFFDSVDRYLEARVDRETFSVSYGGEATLVQRYPISIEWPPAALAGQPSVEACRESVRGALGIPGDRLLGVGVDRLDYTKGIVERFAAVERLLELEPDWRERFVFVQLAAPSRSSIEQYQQLEARVRAAAERVNRRFGTPGYAPIVLRVQHHDASEVYTYYRAAEVCYVSSLHDGMNLVAKEFVAARDDERGVLVLSQFTGAARELVEALIVNPYDVEQAAAALHLALTMPLREQQDRMRSMRSLVQEFNIYRWAGRMLIDAARMRHRRRLSARVGPAGKPLTADAR